MRLVLIVFALILGACTQVKPPFDAKAVHVKYVIQGEGQELIFQDGQLGCPNGQKRLILLNPPARTAYLGCYWFDGDTVRITYEDGDTKSGPKSALQEVDAPNT